jgi:hypothetical protein
MIRQLKVLGLGAATLALSGCATDQSLLLQSGQAFGKGSTAASTVLTGEVDAAPQAEQDILIFKRMPALPTAYDGDFETFACAGLDKGGASASDLATTAQVASTVSTLTAASSAKLNDILASIAKYSKSGPPAIKLPAPPSDKAYTDCKAKVVQGLADLRAPPPESKADLIAIGAALTAAVAVYNAVVAVATDVAQIADVDIREKRLKEFLADSDTQKAMHAALGPCADYDSSLFDANGAPLKTPPACDGPLGKGGEVADLFNRHVASTLVLPYIQYVDTRTEAAGLSPHQIAERLATVQTNLAAFSALRTRDTPDDLGQPIAQAYLDLRRIADGKLTKDERQQAFSDTLSTYAAFMSKLATDVSTLQSKAQAAQQAVNKL